MRIDSVGIASLQKRKRGKSDMFALDKSSCEM
jgi:hypothetical protein